MMGASKRVLNQILEEEVKRMQKDSVNVVNGKLIFNDEDETISFLQRILDEEQRKQAIAEEIDENVLFQDVFKFRGIIGQG